MILCVLYHGRYNTRSLKKREDPVVTILKWIREFVKRFFAVFKRSRRKGFGILTKILPMEEILPAKVILRPSFVPNMPDWKVKYKPTSSRGKDWQMTAVKNLFSSLGLGWVPGEYRRLLENYPLPTVALREFCLQYGISYVGLQNEQPEELLKLQQAVGILLELERTEHELASIIDPDDIGHTRTAVAYSMKIGDYASAEEWLDKMRIMIGICTDPEKEKIVFQEYKSFLQMVRECISDPREITLADAHEMLTHDYTAWQRQFDVTISRLDSQIEWFRANWAEEIKTEDGSSILEYKLKRDGMIALAAELKRSLERDEHISVETSEDSRVESIPQALNVLEHISEDIHRLIEALLHEFGGEFRHEEKVDTSSTATWLQYITALRTIFPRFSPERPMPSEEEVKREYRKLARKYHPEGMEPDEELFKVIAIQYKILLKIVESGVKPKP